MSSNSTILLAGFIVLAGRVAQGKGPTARIIVGLFVLALFLSIISESQPKFGKQFSLLILLVAVFGYVPSILSSIGYPIKKEP